MTPPLSINYKDSTGPEDEKPYNSPVLFIPSNSLHLKENLYKTAVAVTIPFSSHLCMIH
jgi:hypothetical protein